MVNVIRQMAPLFSKTDSNKLWHDVQNEETVIYAKFGKDLFNITNQIKSFICSYHTDTHTMTQWQWMSRTERP